MQEASLDDASVVEVVNVVIAEGCYEASKSSLISDGQNISPFVVDGPLVCSPCPTWPTLMIESSVTLGVVHIVVLVKVGVQAKVVDEPLQRKYATS